MASGLSFVYLTPKRGEKSLQSYPVLACLPGPGSVSLGIWKILSQFHSSGWLLSSHVEVLNLGTADTVDRIILRGRGLSCALGCSSILGCHSPKSWQTKLSSDMAKCPVRGNLPPLRTTIEKGWVSVKVLYSRMHLHLLVMLVFLLED